MMIVILRVEYIISKPLPRVKRLLFIPNAYDNVSNRTLKKSSTDCPQGLLATICPLLLLWGGKV